MSLANKNNPTKPAGFVERLFGSKQKDAPAAQNFLPVPEGISLFHVTHWKAGSQWVRAILEKLYGPAVVPPQNFETQIISQAPGANRVYMCCYVSKVEYDCLGVPAGSRRVVVIRDLRDTLVSAYFSIRFSHPISNPLMEKRRKILTSLNEEQGLMYLLEVWLNWCGVIQQTWVDSGERIFRLEECMKNAHPMLLEIFRSGWKIDVDPTRLQQVIDEYSFEKLSGGRERGKEDVKSHYRKGTHGDWKNHFTPAITNRFKELYGNLLVKTGYEKDLNW